MNFHVATGGTHHVADGRPVYSARFDEVLKFHSPGLAPVRRDGQAWHIQPDGSSAYESRFKRTFGYYEGLSAVIAEEGAFHISPAGLPVYKERYAWCGNFQGARCTVREVSGAYFHITCDGSPAYRGRWRYAGDFRDGIAVVQSELGVSTHIDANGVRLYDRWFLDLDIFHKGFARARDPLGWMHVDASGRPVYERRFASVEPFYNGVARVESFGGALEVIDEAGRTVAVLREPARSEFSALSADMVGFWRTETISSAVKTGVMDAMPSPMPDMAEKLSLQPDRLARLLRALAELELVWEESGTWNLTGRGDFLRRDHPMSLSHAAIEYGRYFPAMWAHLSDALRRDSTWSGPDIFSMVAEDSDRSILHHRMLRSYARHDYAGVPAALKLDGNERLIDAGGGMGELSGALLEYYPGLDLVLLDRPEVVEQACREHPRRDQISWLRHDFFVHWHVKAEVVVMARVLHDWDDVDAVRILTQARACLDAGARLFLVEMVLPSHGYSGGLCDLHLLMATGGRERKAEEFAALLTQTGFALNEIRGTNALPSVLVAEAI